MGYIPFFITTLMQDNRLGAIEAAVLDQIQVYCMCPVDDAEFHNSTSSCSGGFLTFSSTLAHASDDGSVTASILIETLEAALSKEEDPTIPIDGEELAVDVPPDEEIDSFGGTNVFIIAIVSVTASCAVACIIFTR